eukprot:Colp12_sorted_trinity150504_noHs@8352
MALFGNRLMLFVRCLPAPKAQTLPLGSLHASRMQQLISFRQLASASKGASLAEREAEFPHVVRQWHPQKNIVGPQDVRPFSEKRFWFICDKGHEWEARLKDRADSRGCPACSNRKATSTNNLLAKLPKIAADWHPTKNGDLTALMVTRGSKKKVWWQCKEGHEWQTSVANRTVHNSGCPKCAI